MRPYWEYERMEPFKKRKGIVIFFDLLAKWCINLSFILISFCALYLVSVLLFPTLSTEANATLASLLTIGLSDLYLGYGRNK